MKTKEKYKPCVLVNPAYSPGLDESLFPEYNRPVFVCIKDLPTQQLPDSSYNVYVDCTEPSVWCEPLSNVKERNDLDLILTARPELLDGVGCKSVLFPFGSCWIKNLNKKEFGVSFLITSPKGMDGYDIRHRLWAEKDRITIPKYFYNSSRRPLNDNAPKIGESKEKLFDVMFSVCIENTREPYYFSEKLIDALQSKTVPIYYGASCVGEFFDTDGIIIVNNEQEIIDVCNSLTAEDYKKRKDAISKNYETSKQFSGNFPERLFNEIKKHIEVE
jgi:hypothetical protein